jgi:hypothetical protein
MRKRIVSIDNRSKSLGPWLDLEAIATVEVTSKHPDFPIESVFRTSMSADGGLSIKVNGKSESFSISPRP